MTLVNTVPKVAKDPMDSLRRHVEPCVQRDRAISLGDALRAVQCRQNILWYLQKTPALPLEVVLQPCWVWSWHDGRICLPT